MWHIKRRIRQSNRLTKVRLDITHRTKEANAYAFAGLRGWNSPETKFVILAQPRTGSQLLTDLLNSHPDIFCDGEIFWREHINRLLWPQLFLRGRSVSNREKTYGFSLKIAHLPQHHLDPQNFLDGLHQGGWKFIYLTRENLLRQAISWSIAMHRNKWSDTKETHQKFKVVLDTETILQQINLRERERLEEQRILQEMPYLALTYEEGLLRAEQHQNALDKVFDYLGLNSVPVKTRLFRTTSDEMTNFISNYDEVVHFISQTKYARFLEDLH